jgi:hypothetical protein
MQCKARYCAQSKELKFPKKSGYFTERRCTSVAAGTEELCKECFVKSQRPFENKNQQSKYQGKVDEPYFENSWLYGSDRFMAMHRLEGNQLSAADEAMAEAAQRISRQGLQMKANAGRSGKTVPKAPELTVPSVQTYVNNTSSTNVITDVPVAPIATPVAAPKKIVVKRQKKVATVAPAPSEPVSVSVAVESLEPPIEATNVIKIHIRPLEVGGVTYWYAAAKDKVYEKRKDGTRGAYKGRYDHSNQCIVEFPDSDHE